MQIAILVITVLVAIAAGVVIYLMLKMIRTGDYSLLVSGQAQTTERYEPTVEKSPIDIVSEAPTRAAPQLEEPADATPTLLPRPFATAQRLAWVAHFAGELREWESEEQRAKHVRDLEEIRLNRREESREK